MLNSSLNINFGGKGSSDPKTPLETASTIASAFNAVNGMSLPEYTAPARLNPIVLIDKRVMAADQSQLTALLQTLLSVYSAYYLMAINISMNVGNVNVISLLDQFSTERSISAALMGNNELEYSNETIDDTVAYLPTYGLEATYYQHGNFIPENDANIREEKLNTINAKTKPAIDNDKAIHNITDESNLVVGKLIDVKISDKGETTTMPVMITLNPKGIDPEDFLDISRANSIDVSITGRWHAWRSGEIRFIKDYLLCMDLIDTDKKALLADKTGTLLGIRSRRTKDIAISLQSGKVSPNSVSTMIIISKQTASDLELIIKGSLKSSHIRANYFANVCAMMLVVVDIRMERFIMYQRGIDDFKEYTFEDIKQNGKKPNGVDISSIIKAYKLGDSPSL